MSLRTNTLRFSRTPLLIKVIVGVIAIASLAAPMNFLLISPGPVTKLFPKVLSINTADNVRAYPVHGQLNLLTIYVTNPETKVFGVEVLGCWIQGDCVVLPRSVMYKKGTTDAQESKSGYRDMVKSQSTALKAAVNAIGRNFPDVNLAGVSDASIKVSLKNTGGPSGGLVFTLGLIDLLTPQDILQGRNIAGTGTIAADGTIGAIGGVTEKIIGARKAGASILFISTQNCQQLPKQVGGISVIAIEKIDQAIKYLMAPDKAFDSAGIHGCASVGA